MAGSFVATMAAVQKRPANTARAADEVTIRFSDPPETATDVMIEVMNDAGKVLATFYGVFKDRAYKNQMTSGNLFVSRSLYEDDKDRANLDREKHMHIVLHVEEQKSKSNPDGKSSFKLWMSDSGGDKFKTSNKLKLKVTGTIPDAGTQTFEGKTLLHVFYPLAMIVPSGWATHDPALNVIPKWAAQWQARHKEMRTVVTVPIIRPPSLRNPSRGITTADYDPLVAAVKKAVAAAPNGIIALTVGHGDGGFAPDYVAWCDLMPEDAREDNGYPRNLAINAVWLSDGAGDTHSGVKQTPEGTTIIRLNALDRMADELVRPDNPMLRKLLLHTCKAGNSLDFMQKLANRLRVRVQSHTDSIEYTGDVQGSIQAAYAGETPVDPQSKEEWPTGRVGREFYPSQAPPERYPP